MCSGNLGSTPFYALTLLTTLITACQPGNEPGKTWQVETLVPGGALHSPNGITFGPDGQLYAGSVGAQTIYRVNVDNGDVTIIVPAPAGEADDVAFAPDGTLVWTALIGGEIRALREDGTVDAVVSDITLVNPVYFTTDGRLFAAQIGIDRLYEFPIDDTLTSIGERRLVASKIGNLNSFEIDAENRLFGPLFNKGTVAWIDIDSGAVTPVAEDLGKVVAVNLDSNGNVWTIDWASGTLWRIEADGEGWREAQKVATLEPPLDNLAVGPDGAIYVSRPAHSAIDRVDPDTGAITPIITGHLAAPGGLAITRHEGRESLLVADGYGYRIVDTRLGTVTTTFDLTEFGFPGAATAAAASNEFFALTNAASRSRIYLVDRSSGKNVARWTGIKTPLGIILNDEGNPLVTDFESGTLIALTRADTKQRNIITEGLAGPVGLAWHGIDTVYVTEAVGGAVVDINLTDGTRMVVTEGLARPEGLAVMSDGRLAVVEAGRQRLIAINPADGTFDVLAENLPVKEPATDPSAPVQRPSGVAQGADGSLYVSGTLDHSIVKLTL
jgi:sugar lactone lactonase YvrE